ncbi:MAG: nucleotidyltransferase domain-containing protein [Spirochaetales bacterium]|jgi:predicted nucleotidyltransferase|nr:nucleotidyltransferase domain-containing protein [Spirochaetales bacterium]
MMTDVEIAFEKKYETLVREKILALFTETAARIFLFGSRVRGDYKRGSDFDIGFENIEEKLFRRLRIRFLDYWEESIIPYKVDMVLFDSADPDFIKEAKKDLMVWKDG